MTKKILFLDTPSGNHLPDPSLLRMASFGADPIAVTTEEAATAVLHSSQLDVIVANYPYLQVFQQFKDRFPHGKSLLVTDLPMERYSELLGGSEHILVDNVIAGRGPVSWTINEIRVALQKIIREDIFGLEKYLAPTANIYELTVTGSTDREQLNAAVMQLAEENRLGQYFARVVFGITEELLMNAIYDAPVAGGKTHYSDLPRTSVIRLEPAEYAKLSFGCDGTIFGISVQDPFGALSRDTLFRYLKKVIRRSDSASLIDSKKGGAGLGLFKILYGSHALVCNVRPSKQTEVIALIDVQAQVRDFSKMTRSVHFFSVA